MKRLREWALHRVDGVHPRNLIRRLPMLLATMLVLRVVAE